ncbi:unnamed protein product, partial [Rotaria sp. Silwood2]
MVSSRDNNNDQPDESSNAMDYDLTQEATTPNLATDEVITDSVIDDDILTGDENDHLNCSSETVDELNQTKGTTHIFSNTNENSDTNLRSHLGKTHRMIDFLYPSQKDQQQPKLLKKLSAEEKKILNAAAIEAIVKDALPFNHFSKTGMLRFLSIIKPGYRGPHRKTVRKHLVRLYQQQQQLIKQELSSISHISLTAD